MDSTLKGVPDMFKDYRGMIGELYDYLRIEPCSFRFKALPYQGDYEMLGNCYPKRRSIEISKDTSPYIKGLSIAHELRHQWQYDEGILTIDSKGVHWFNSFYPIIVGKEYYFMPHEADAILFSIHFMRRQTQYEVEDFPSGFPQRVIRWADDQLTKNPRRAILFPR